MKTTITFLCLFLPWSLVSQIDAGALMRLSADKVSQVHSLEYDFVHESYFANGNFLRYETTVQSRRVTGKPAGKLTTPHYKKLKGTRYRSSGDQTVSFEYLKGDGKSILVDHSTKEARRYSNDMDIMVELNIVGMHILGSYFDHFYRTDPMNQEENYHYRLQGEKMYGGTMCYEISKLSGSQQDDAFYWYIAQEDSLPRGYKMSSRAMEVFLKRVDFDPPLSEFDLRVPEGYDDKEVTERNLGDLTKPNNREADKRRIAFESGAVLPKWETTDLEGKPWSSSSLVGKVVVLDFWGVWCAPCVKAMPKVQQLYDNFKDQGLVVLGMDVKDTEQKVRSFLERNDYTYPIVHAAEPIAKKFKVSSFPTLFIIDRQGKLLHAETGYRSNAYAEWTEIINKALK